MSRPEFIPPIMQMVYIWGLIIYSYWARGLLVGVALTAFGLCLSYGIWRWMKRINNNGS